MLSEILGEDDTGPRRAGVVVNLSLGPTLGFVKQDRALIAKIGDGLEPAAASQPRFFLKGVVEHLTDPTPAIIRMDPYEVHVARLRRAGRDEAKKKPNEDAVVLNNARLGAQLIEENGVRQSAGGPAPPAVNDLNDVLVVVLSERTSDHVEATMLPLASLPSRENLII